MAVTSECVKVGRGVDYGDERPPVRDRRPELEPLDVGALHHAVVQKVLLDLGLVSGAIGLSDVSKCCKE